MDLESDSGRRTAPIMSSLSQDKKFEKLITISHPTNTRNNNGMDEPEFVETMSEHATPSGIATLHTTALSNSSSLLMMGGKEWTAIAYHMKSLRLSHHPPPHQAHKDTALYRPNRLSERDMDMFGFAPAKDGLLLVVCIHCAKAVKASRFASHFRRCPSRFPSTGVHDRIVTDSRPMKRKSPKDGYRMDAMKRKKACKPVQELHTKKKPVRPLSKNPQQSLASEDMDREDEEATCKGNGQDGETLSEASREHGSKKGAQVSVGRGRGRGKALVISRDKDRKLKGRQLASLIMQHNMGIDAAAPLSDDPLHRLLRRAAMPALAAPLATRIYIRRNRLRAIHLQPQDVRNANGSALPSTSPAAAVATATITGVGRAGLSLGGSNGNLMGGLAINGHPFAAINGFINAIQHPPSVGISPAGLLLTKGQLSSASTSNNGSALSSASGSTPSTSHGTPGNAMLTHTPHHHPTAASHVLSSNPAISSLHQLPITYIRGIPSTAMVPHPLLPGKGGNPPLSPSNNPSPSSPSVSNPTTASPATTGPPGPPAVPRIQQMAKPEPQAKGPILQTAPTQILKPKTAKRPSKPRPARGTSSNMNAVASPSPPLQSVPSQAMTGPTSHPSNLSEPPKTSSMASPAQGPGGTKQLE